ncbi:transforming growth factor-beta receptor-associated protein 1 [Anabrus simplex]|uniref:transforming growth factor-beta receptor-associated protein 1 n=1 Tax=Anabrus simplex TaxID=316456 RepID=UPI0035A35ED7
MSVKAFDCVPVIDTLHLQGEKALTRIECVDCCGNILYIGTSDGFVMTFSIEEVGQESGKILYVTKKLLHKCIEVRKAIKCIKAALVITRLLVLCDSNLYILSMSQLETLGDKYKVRDVVTFCVNETPDMSHTFCTQICVAHSRRVLQVFNITDEKMSNVRDISLEEPALEVAMNGLHICAALRSQYVIHNLENGHTQMLFTYDSKKNRPVICSISEKEFLVSVEDVGMFATTLGISNRTPIQWSYPVIALAYSHPYILGLSDGVIMVYSILDQQQKHTKQAIQFSGGRCICRCDAGVFVASASSVYSLIPVPWEKQVEDLLADERVDEALELARYASPIGMDKDKFRRMYLKIKQKAGFIYFSKCDFDKAREMFETGRVDVREVISLFPGLMPLSSTFIRAVSPLHGIADVFQLYHGDEAKLKDAKRFLLHFLRDIRENNSSNYAVEIDTALLKLYCEINSAELEAFIAAGEITCDLKDCCSWLEKNQCYHGLALLYRHAKDHEKALKVWSKIISGEYKDENFHGLPFFVECLANLKEYELVWRYADFVLDCDEEVGVRIFTLRSNEDFDSEAMKPDIVVDYLYRYPKAVILYLEHLVMVKNIQIEKFHTHLAVLYLENISSLRKENNDEGVKEARVKIQNLLQHSNLCRVQLLLGKMQDAGLHQETAILYGKLEEHRKALNILVYQLKDFKAAEMYCVNNSQGRDVKYKNNLFFTLLSTYLSPELESSQKDEFLCPAMDLLNSRARDFDPVKVLEIIPGSWSVSALGSFLTGGLRTSLHKYRMSKLQAALARGENLQKRFQLYEMQRKYVKT